MRGPNEEPLDSPTAGAEVGADVDWPVAEDDVPSPFDPTSCWGLSGRLFVANVRLTTDDIVRESIFYGNNRLTFEHGGERGCRFGQGYYHDFTKINNNYNNIINIYYKIIINK